MSAARDAKRRPEAMDEEAEPVRRPAKKAKRLVKRGLNRTPRPTLRSRLIGLAIILGVALAAALLTVMLAGRAAAAEAGGGATPAIVYSTGGKFDKSFNQGAWNGARRWAEESGGTFAEFQIDGLGQSEQALRSFARRGNDPVAAIGFGHASALAEVAPRFPQTRFAIIDAVVEGANIRSITFREEEGGYLVGLLGAMASETGALGFVGGMDIPLIRNFACGYIQGAAAAPRPAEVLVNYAGDTPAAWSDPARGAEIARSQIARGADVILQAAGGTGIGVLQAAADAEGVLGIGSDSNQNGLHPGQVLTTMLKRVDVAVERLFAAAAAGGFAPGAVSLGVAEGGVGWALDAHNRDLIAPEMEAAARAAEADIAAGRIAVATLDAEGACPAP